MNCAEAATAYTLAWIGTGPRVHDMETASLMRVNEFSAGHAGQLQQARQSLDRLSGLKLLHLCVQTAAHQRLMPTASQPTEPPLD